ncbi:NOLC1 protein, partial [Nothocercus nigrocapillus]|nr:NOLC1 protein [Nothocercus nigrocapillus]
KLDFIGKAVVAKTVPGAKNKAVTVKKAESSSDSDSDSSSEEDKKVAGKLPAKQPVIKNSSKPAKAPVKPASKAALPATKKPQATTKKARSSSDSDSSSSSSEDEKKKPAPPAKLTGKVSKPVSKPCTPAPEASSSDSDSSSSEEEKKPAVKPIIKSTGATKAPVGKKMAAATSSSSSSDSSSEADEKPKKAGKGALNGSHSTPSTGKAKASSTPAANKLKSKAADGSSSSSESSSEEETGKANGGTTCRLGRMTQKKRKREDVHEVETPDTKKTKIKAKTPNTFPRVKQVREDRPSSPFRRVREEEIELDARVADNSFDAKKGAAGDWGEKANNILKFTKGKSFRHEKTKKKRGSYCGGTISTQVNSIKFESD